jgi:hypothetical protein
VRLRATCFCCACLEYDVADSSPFPPLANSDFLGLVFLKAVLLKDADDTTGADGEAGLAELLCDDLNRGVGIEEAVADDLANDLVGADIVAFGAGLLAQEPWTTMFTIEFAQLNKSIFADVRKSRYDVFGGSRSKSTKAMERDLSTARTETHGNRRLGKRIVGISRAANGEHRQPRSSARNSTSPSVSFRSFRGQNPRIEFFSGLNRS